MNAITASIKIYSINEEELELDTDELLFIHGDGKYVEIEIKGQKYGVVANDLMEAIRRCSDWE